MNLKKAREENKLEEFIRERETLAPGDPVRLKLAVESMTHPLEQTKKPAPETSPSDRGGN